MVTNHEHGGYQMDDNEIGMFVMIVAIVVLFYQVGIVMILKYTLCCL